MAQKCGAKRLAHLSATAGKEWILNCPKEKKREARSESINQTQSN
jgi:hypothetical protein